MYIPAGFKVTAVLRNFLLCFRFYIESISYLKDNATIELFFLNAKSIIYKVNSFSLFSWCIPKTAGFW